MRREFKSTSVLAEKMLHHEQEKVRYQPELEDAKALMYDGVTVPPNMPVAIKRMTHILEKRSKLCGIHGPPPHVLRIFLYSKVKFKRLLQLAVVTSHHLNRHLRNFAVCHP